MLAVQRRSLLNQPLDTVPLTFTRPSVAYTWDGKPLPPNTPRFEQLIDGKLEYGCLIEQAHTNYDTAFESQHPTYSAGGTTPPSIDNYSTEYKLFGDHSCKITFNIISPEYGAGAVAPNVLFNHPNGATLTYMAWIYSETAFTVTMAITGFSALGSKIINIVPGLNVYSVTVSNTLGSTQAVGIFFYNASALATMYICGRQILDAPFPLSWTLGGTTQADETLTALGSVLNIDEEGYSNIFLANQADPITTTGWEGWNADLSNGVDDDIGNVLICTQNTDGYAGSDTEPACRVVSGGVEYNISLNIEGNNEIPFYCTVSCYDSSWNNIGGMGNTLIGIIPTESQRFDFTYTTPANAVYSAFHIFWADGSVGDIIKIGKLQYSATDEPKPWIPGGTQVNTGSWTIELEAYIPDWMLDNDIPVRPFNFIQFEKLCRFDFRYYRDGLSKFLQSILRSSDNHWTNMDYVYAIQEQGWYKLGFTIDSESFNIFVNGDNEKTGEVNELPTDFPEKLYIGSYSNGYQQLNSIIRNVTISYDKRVDADVTARAGKGEGQPFGLDRQVRLYAPLMHDLRAYRVRA